MDSRLRGNDGRGVRGNTPPRHPNEHGDPHTPVILANAGIHCAFIKAGLCLLFTGLGAYPQGQNGFPPARE